MQARSVLELFAREVRRAGTNPTCVPGVEAIVDAKQHLLRIQADLDGDGTFSGANEDVTYEYKFSQDRLERVANGVSEALVVNADMAGSGIRYFDGSGTEITAGATGLSTAERGNVRRIRMELTLASDAVDPQNSMPLQSRLATDVDLRNRFFVSDVTCS
jgi:hypothetical protein